MTTVGTESPVDGRSVFKLLGVLVFVAVLSVALAAGTAAADPSHQTSPECESVEYDGSGADDDPYLIEDLTQLQCLGDDATQTTHFDHYRLIDDIDASPTESWNENDTFSQTVFNGGTVGEQVYAVRTPVVEILDDEDASLEIVDEEEGILEYTENTSETFSVTYRTDEAVPRGFEPIGTFDERFQGTVDGNGHTVDGVYIDRQTDVRIGLFGVIDGGTVTDLSVEAATVTGAGSVGALAGSVKSIRSDAVIERSHASGDVTAIPPTPVEGEDAGGLVGDLRGGVVRNSSASVTVRAQEQAGGLAGSNRGLITESSASGAVLAGEQHPGTTTTTGFGGLVADNTGGNITDSFATGDVDGGDGRIGGLVGINREVFGNRAIIERSYATGDVTRGGDSTFGGIGALVGDSDGYSLVSESYATGTVDDVGDAGGLIGVMETTFTEPDEDVVLRDAYWDTEGTGLDEPVGERDDSDSGDGELIVENVSGHATAELQGAHASSTMTAFDFDADWQSIEDPDDYPRLAWEQSTRVVDYADETTGQVETDGVRSAIKDWQTGTIDTALLVDVIDAWAAGKPLR